MGHPPSVPPQQGTQNENMDPFGPPPPFPTSQDARGRTNFRRGGNRDQDRDHGARRRPYNQVTQINNMDPSGPPPPFSTTRDERGRTSLRRDDNQDQDRDRSHNHRYRNGEGTSRDASRNRDFDYGRDDSIPTRENGSRPSEPRGSHPFVFNRITNREQRDPSPRDLSQTRGPRQVRNDGFAID